jgi:hypothetical protein
MNKTISGSLLLALLSACSLLVERSDAQCANDTDCLKFQTEQTGRTVCENKVCVASGLGPTGCFFGTPTTNAEYLNACSAAACRPFDNCARIGLCDGGAPPSDPTPPPTSVPGTAVVNPTPVPTVTCSQEGVNVIYMYGAADFAPLLKAVQPLLNASTPAYRAVFQNASSCAGVTSIFSPDPTKRLIKDVPSTPTRAANYAFFFDESGAQVNCLLDPAGNTVEIGVSDLYSTTCDPSYKTGQAFAGYTGPVVAFSLAVPLAPLKRSSLPRRRAWSSVGAGSTPRAKTLRRGPTPPSSSFATLGRRRRYSPLSSSRFPRPPSGAWTV